MPSQNLHDLLRALGRLRGLIIRLDIVVQEKAADRIEDLPGPGPKLAMTVLPKVIGMAADMVEQMIQLIEDPTDLAKVHKLQEKLPPEKRAT